MNFISIYVACIFKTHMCGLAVLVVDRLNSCFVSGSVNVYNNGNKDGK